MSEPVGPFLPTAALVVTSWIGQRVPGIAAAMCSTRLPRDVSKWAEQGFVQITIVPGSTEVDSGGRRRAIAQVDAWGVAVATDLSTESRPAVNKATRLAELIIRATEDDIQSFGRPVTLPTNYLDARVLAAYPLTDPSPIPDDPSGYGRVTFDLALDWVRL